MGDSKVYHSVHVVNTAPTPGNPPPYSTNPPPPSFGPATVHYGGSTSAIVVQPTMMQPTVVVLQQYGPRPAQTTCKSCQSLIITRTTTKPAMKTHFYALCLFVFCLWPCAFVPYCVDSCMNIDHYCPNCNAFIGTYLA